MTPERSKQIRDLFDAALEAPALRGLRWPRAGGVGAGDFVALVGFGE